jgi:hypothetical protein
MKWYFCINDIVQILAERGGSVARVAKEAFEEQTGKKVVSSLSMKQYLESQQPKLDLEDEQ